MKTEYLLDWISNLINGLIIIFLLVSAINTACFKAFEWGLTLTALSFSVFVKIISNLTKDK